MPKAVFLVKSIVQRWEPPFGKEETSQEIEASEGQQFDEMEKPKCFVFRLVKCNGNKALVEFDRLFTLKGHEHPGNRQIWLSQEQPVDFTYMWGSNGMTKNLELKEIRE